MSLFAFGNKVVDRGERRGRFLQIALGALRVGLIEELIDLGKIILAQRLRLLRALHGFLRRRELLGALILALSRLVDGKGGPTQQAGQGRTDHDTSEHRMSPWKFEGSFTLRRVKVN